MNVEANNVEKKAVHSWSRISSAGQKALEEALRVFNPMSKDLSDTETQLIAFLQGLKEEGYQPTILRSKDVYGYSSCTANAPGQTKGCHRDIPEPEPAKAPARKIVTVKKVSDPLAGMTVSSSKDSTKPTSKGSNSTNLLLNSLKQTRSGTSKASAVGFPANMYPGVYPAMRLSVVLEALVPLKATASCLESKCQQGHRGIAPSDLKLLKASSASIQSSAVKATKILPSQLDPKGLNPKGHRRLITKVPDSATLAVSLIKGPKGGMPQECHAYKAPGILNGRIPGSNFQSCSPGASRMKEPSEARTEQESGDLRQETVGPKRKRVGEGKELCRKMPNCIPSPDKQGLDSKTLNLLKFQAIKVNSSSDDELRRRAQKILRVNLSPVIRIQPLPCSPSGP